MVTGITTPWGYSPQNIANMTYGLNESLTNMLSLSSVPPTFQNGVYKSPMTDLHNAFSTYNFGRSKFGSYRDPQRRLIYTPPVPVALSYPRPCAPRPCVQRKVNCDNGLLARSGVSYNCHERTTADNPKKLTMNGKTFTINSRAYFTQGQMGTIIGMGCKQILILNQNGLVKRVKLAKFIDLNKN
jgi:hypothetical protein